MKRCLLLVALLVATVGFAKIPQPQKNTYVNDFAQVLTPGQVKNLNAKIHRIERLSSVQMAIVLVNKLPEEYDIEDYALLIGRKWRVGKNKNGIVYVAAIQQRKQRLEVARLLVNKLNDSKCAEILDGIKPYFKENDYNGGLESMIDAVSEEVVVPVNDAKPVAAVAPQQKANKPGPIVDAFTTIIAIVILVGIPALVIYLLVRLFRRRRNNVIVQNPQGYINNYNNGGGYNNNNYGQPYGGGYMGDSGSNMRAGLGGFVAGAATGYAVRTIQDHLSDDDDDNRRNYHEDDTDNVTTVEDNEDDSNEITSSDEDSSNWGNWGSNSDSDSSDDSSDNDKSSNSGFDGGSGATSSW